MRRSPPRPFTGAFAPARKAPPRGRKSNSRRGTAVEGVWGGRGAVAVLAAEGYRAMPAHGGTSAADVNASKFDPYQPGPSLRRVQCKRQATFRPSGLNDAVCGWLGYGRHKPPHALAADEQREAWLWCDQAHAWVARVIVTHGHVVPMDGARIPEVMTSIEAMLAREQAKRAQAPASFRRRLKVQRKPKEQSTMALRGTVQESSVPDIDFGVYDAEVTALDETVSKFDANVPQVVITYTLDVDGEQVPVKEWVSVTPYFTPRSRIYARASALMFNGDAIEAGYNLDTSDFLGRECRVQWGSFSKKDGTKGVGVTDVLPPRAKRRQQAAPTGRTQGAGRRPTARDIDDA